MAILLQVAILLVGFGVLALMLWEPRVEGRNAHSTLLEIYFSDPFLAYVYLASIPFFVILYQAFKLVGLASRDEVLSKPSMKALRTIRYCAIALAGLITAAETYLFIVMRGTDEGPGGLAVGLFMLLVAIVIAATATLFERRIQTSIACTQSQN